MTSLLYFSLQGHGDDDEPEADSALPAESTEAAAGSTGGYVADMEPPVPLPVAAPVEAEESEEDMGNVSWRVFIYPPGN